MLQAFANHLVQAQQVGRRDALAIRRIHNHDALLLRSLEILEVLLCYGNVLAQSGCLYIGRCNLHGMAVDVISIDVVLEFMLVAVILINAVKEFAVKVGPLLKGIFLTEHTGADASGNQSRLNGKGSASAHRVNQVTLATPSGLQDDSRSQHLVERCLHSLLTVSTAVQALTAAVQTQSTVILCHMNVQFYVGVYYSYVGTVASFLAELVHNGILYLICHKLTVAELVAEHHTVHGECGLVCQIL